MLPFESAHVTAPLQAPLKHVAGSIAKVTITVFPAATPAAGTLTAIDVWPEVSFAFVPMFLTKAMPAARASDAARLNRSASASVATARRAGSRFFSPEVGGRQVVRFIVSPSRIANSDQQ